MARFSQGFRTTNTTSGQAALELIGGAGVKARLVEFGITTLTQVVASVGIGYPAAIGRVPTTPVTFLGDSQDSSVIAITSALAWGTPPTLPNYFYRRGSIALTQDELVWTWPEGGGIMLLPSTSIVLWLFATAPQLDGWAVFEQ